MIGIHIGIPWHDEMIAMAWKRPTCSSAPIRIARSTGRKASWFIDSFAQDKVIFGTDFRLSFPTHDGQIAALGLKPEVRHKFMRENVADLPLGDSALPSCVRRLPQTPHRRRDSAHSAAEEHAQNQTPARRARPHARRVEIATGSRSPRPRIALGKIASVDTTHIDVVSRRHNTADPLFLEEIGKHGSDQSGVSRLVDDQVIGCAPTCS